MPEQFENTYLSAYSLHVCVLDDLLLLQDLDSNFLARGLVNPQLDFPEGALPNGLGCMIEGVQMR